MSREQKKKLERVPVAALPPRASQTKRRYNARP
jgi:hypothetical protein